MNMPSIPHPQPTDTTKSLTIDEKWLDDTSKFSPPQLGNADPLMQSPSVSAKSEPVPLSTASTADFETRESNFKKLLLCWKICIC